MEGNDLVKFNNFNYQKSDYIEGDLHYEETYSYDTTINPLWPIIQNSTYFARLFLEIQWKQMRPFAFTVSKHNPLNEDVTSSFNLWLPAGVTFEYKYEADVPYPTEQKWVNKRDGSVYTTYRYEYIKIPK
jgi:hypothetical protein